MDFFRKWFAPHPTLILFAIGMSAAVSTKAQTASPSNADQSWTANSQMVATNANPSRATESHIKSGNRSLDKKTVEVLGPDGHDQPYLEVETETIQDSPTSLRSIRRTFNPDADGHEQLTRMTEAETQNSADGVTRTLRAISNPDSAGNLQVVEREVTTATQGPESQDAHTTIYLPDISGKLAPSMQIHEQQARGPNDQIATKKTILLPDSNGGWQIHEVQEQTVKGDAQNRTTEDHTSRPDFEGNLSPVLGPDCQRSAN